MDNAGQGRVSDMMKDTFYVGNKVVLAYPMTREQYCKYRGWDLPEGEDPEEEVLLVEYEPVEGELSNMAAEGHAGYVSMSPKSVFKDAYRVNGHLDAGSALLGTKRGNMIRRQGWPKGHFVFRQIPANIPKKVVPTMQSLPQSVKNEFVRRFNDPAEQIDAIYYDYQLAYVGDSNLITGYSPSSEDVIAEDWEILS